MKMTTDQFLRQARLSSKNYPVRISTARGRFFFSPIWRDAFSGASMSISGHETLAQAVAAAIRDRERVYAERSRL